MNSIVQELYVHGFPVQILKSEEGEIFAAFDAPQPSPEESEKILAYLRNEGFLPEDPGWLPPSEQEPPQNKQILTPKIVITHEDGSKETFALDQSDILAYDPDLHEVTISLHGKVHLIDHVTAVETQEA